MKAIIINIDKYTNIVTEISVKLRGTVPITCPADVFGSGGDFVQSLRGMGSIFLLSPSNYEIWRGRRGLYASWN